MMIQLPNDLESSIREAVQTGRFATVDEAMAEAARLLLRAIQPTLGETNAAAVPDAETAHQPIWERAEELRKRIPPEEWEKLPVDGASQHDHYIYGTPKRPKP